MNYEVHSYRDYYQIHHKDTRFQIEKLADLNWNRNNEFNKEHSSKNSRPAIFTFDGDVYNGIDSKTLNSEDINQLQKSLIILSGLYGALKPLDLIQPYRLEMGTKLAVNGSRNLYEFWADAITNDLVKDLKSDSILVNLASNEYFNVIKKSKIEQTIITPVFKDFKNGNLKVISFYAKKARGMMVRFIVKNNFKFEIFGDGSQKKKIFKSTKEYKIF